MTLTEVYLVVLENTFLMNRNYLVNNILAVETHGITKCFSKILADTQ